MELGRRVRILMNFALLKYFEPFCQGKYFECTAKNHIKIQIKGGVSAKH